MQMKSAASMRRIGWLCFSLGWIPFTGIFIGMMGMPNGSYDWVELPVIARYSMIGTGVMFGLAMLLIFGSYLFSAALYQSVIKNGQLAEATILGLRDTGTTVNQNPLVHLTLEVHPRDLTPNFQAETEMLVSRLQIPQIQPGAVVNVRYDPESKEVAIVSGDDAQGVVKPS
jgi:hypothetical protein